MKVAIHVMSYMFTSEGEHHPKQRNGGVIMEIYFMRITEMFMAGLIILNGVMMIISASDLGGINAWLQKHFACFRTEDEGSPDRNRKNHSPSRNAADLK